MAAPADRTLLTMTPCLAELHALFLRVTARASPGRLRSFPWLLLIAAWQISGIAVADETSTAGASASPAQTSEVAMPLRLDYPLLQQLLVSQLFTGDEGSRELLNDPSGCSEIVLSEPALAPRDAQLEVLAGLRARVGVGAPGACATLLRWQGRIGVTGRPETRNNGTALGFAPDRIWLLDQAGQPVANDRLQQMADASVRALFSRFVVDLAPQLQSVGTLLPEVLPRHSRQQIQALLDTLRLHDLQVNDDSLDAAIVFAVEPASGSLPPERALTDEELDRWEERWQLMDSVLVLAVKHYAAATQLQVLRDALLDVLIESRYRLRDALVETPEIGGDVVRTWFLQSWESLAPVIRRIGLEQPGQEHLLLFSVIAATDALEALDQLGPNIGLDISADGLRRLARMINDDAGDALLQYSGDVDPVLRRLLEQSLEATPPPSAWRLDFSLFPKATAADMDRLNSWAPQREDLEEYLPQVAVLLQASASKAVASQNLDPAYAELFRRLVLATAWQESCWRHYVVSDDRKLVPLRSGSGDVGLMQVNERVWRGFYSQQQLRWDIGYNSAAGAEVLLDYLVKYAIRKGEHRQPGGLANLARASYSAYNGGPSQVSRYRSDKASAYGKKVDALFWDKYQQVAAGNELAVSRCLGGDLSGPAAAGSAGKAPGAGATAARPSAPFTLQLGVFSAAESAQSFISENALAEKARVQRRRKGDTGQYLVLYGSYVTRAEAETAKQGLAAFQPWIRRFGEL
ncbi:MAG: transglycosylase SLT domain-containing protein [Chromatocurvus sp.]